MTYINREIDEIYFQYNILCLVSICRYFFIHFSRSVLLKLLKHVKLIAFENIMKVKQKNFFDKKIGAQFDKKIATWWRKSIDDPRKESTTVDPEEHSITEDS